MKGHSSPKDEPIGPTSNLFTKTTDYIDKNLQVIRYVSVYGLAGIGVILILRSTYAFSKFRNAKDVPRNFVTRHAKLHGHVMEVTDAGHILVDHSPIFKVGKGTHGKLPLTLAGVELNHLAVPWLQDNISKKHIWFKILQLVPSEKDTPKSPMLTGGRKQWEVPKDVISMEENTSIGQIPSGGGRLTLGGHGEERIPTISAELALIKALPPDKALECIITAKKGFLRNMIVNEQLIYLGMATVAHIDGLEGDMEVTKLTARLVKAEVRAQKKGHGIWTRPSLRECLWSYPGDLRRRVVEYLKKTFSRPSKKDNS